jgi:hypothetical protein
LPDPDAIIAEDKQTMLSATPEVTTTTESAVPVELKLPVVASKLIDEDDEIT